MTADTPGLVLPVQGPVTQAFNGSSPFEGAGYLQTDSIGPYRARTIPFTNGVRQPHLHHATDIQCATGTPVHASESGIIVFSGHVARLPNGQPDGEICTIIRIHLDAKYQTCVLYTHLSKFNFLPGHRVAKGDVLAVSGNSGISTAPHVHWQVGVAFRTADVLTFFQGRAWAWYDPMRCLEGKDLASRPFLVPNA